MFRQGAMTPERQRAAPEPRKRYDFLLIGVVASCVILLIGMLLYFRYADHLRDQEHKEVQSLVEVRRDEINALLKERVGDALMLSRNPNVIEALERASGNTAGNRVEALVKNLDEAYGYRRVQILDRQLRPQLQADWPLNKREIAEARAAIADGRYRVFDQLAEGDAIGECEAHIKIIHPIKAGEGPGAKVLGAILIDLGDEQDVLGLLEPRSSQFGSARLELYERSASGKLTGYGLTGPAGKREVGAIEWRSAEDGAKFDRQIAQLRSGMFGAIDQRGKDVVVAVEPVEELGLLLVGTVDREEIDQPLRLQARGGGIVGALAIALLIMGYLLFARREQGEKFKKEAAMSRRYIASIQHMMEGFIRLDSDGIIVEFNDAARELSGYSRGGLEGLHITHLARGADDEAQLMHLVSRLPDTKSERFLTTWRKMAGGSAIVEGVATYVVGPAGADIFLTIRDVTKEQASRRRLERLNNLHRYLEHVHREIVGKSDPDQILRLACQGMPLDSNILLMWSGKVNRTEQCVEVVAASGPAYKYVNEVLITLDPSKPGSKGPVGHAVREDRIVVRRGYKEYESHEERLHWADRAKQFGLNSQMVVPLRSGEEVYAVLSYYSELDDYFDPEVQSLLVQMADAISTALDAAISRQATIRAEKALEDRIRLYGAVVESALESIALLDPDTGDFIEFNTAAHENLGYTREEFAQIKVWDLLEDFPDERAAQQTHHHFDGNSRQVRRHPRHKDGTVREIQVSISELTVDDRFFLCCIWHDVTDEAEAERARAAEAEKHRVLFEESTVGILVADETGRIIDANASVIDLLGSTRKKFIGSPVWNWGRRFSDAAGWEQFKAQILNTDVGLEAEATLLRADGSEVEVDRAWNTAKVQGEQLFYCSLRDITERKAIENELAKHRSDLEELVKERSRDLVETAERLEASEQRYAYAAEATSDGIWDWSAATGKVTVNASYASMIGYSVNALAATPEELAEIVHREDVDRFLASWKPPGDESHRTEFRMRAKDGTYRWILNRCKVVERSADGAPLRIVGTHTDITRRKEVEELLLQAKDAAEAADRAKSGFLAMVSHEFRTPLNGVIGMTEVLLGEELKQNQFEMVQIIRDSGLNLMGLINDILDFSKIEAGRLELDFGPTSIGKVIEGVCDALAPSAEASRVDLSLFVSPLIPDRVMCDPARLRQILLNIVGNAVKFSGGRSDRRGMVEIRAEWAEADEGKVRINVQDNGIGLSPSAKSRLFTPFVQGEASATRRFGGTGLGLAISKRLLDLMGGSIEVTSGEGAGSAFTIEFPTRQMPGQTAVQSDALADLDCLLLAPAGAIDAEGIAEHLRWAGANVEFVSSPDVAIGRLLKSRRPALVVELAGPGGEAQAEVDLPATAGWLVLRCSGRWRAFGWQGRLREGMPLGWLRGDVLVKAAAICAGRMELDERGSVTDPTGVPVQPEPPSIEEARARNELVLVADDDEINRNVIRRQLARIGFNCEIAKDGTEAFSMWKTGRYAMVLSDYLMPGLDGFELAAAIRAMEGPAQRVPIVILSASARGMNSEHRITSDIDGYLVKPVQLHDLFATVQALFGRQVEPAEETGTSAPADREEAPSAADFEPATLGLLIGDDPEFIRVFLRDFLKISKQIVADLKRAIKTGDNATAIDLAHRLKSSSRSSGAMRLGEICHRIERDAEAGRTEALGLAGIELQAALDTCHARISAFIDESAAPPKKRRAAR
jgi:PAS domain S-box-containing protein